jgi:hypothetical protein
MVRSSFAGCQSGEVARRKHRYSDREGIRYEFAELAGYEEPHGDASEQAQGRPREPGERRTGQH